MKFTSQAQYYTWSKEQTEKYLFKIHLMQFIASREWDSTHPMRHLKKQKKSTKSNALRIQKSLSDQLRV